MTRFKILQKIFNEHRCFKVVCGAGNEDIEEVRKLTKIYTLAGATIIDVSASVEVVDSSAIGIKEAFTIASQIGIDLPLRPFINVSVGLEGDPHVRKAVIDKERCSNCGLCQDACEQDAITNDYSVLENRCIGCGKCDEICEFDAISFYHKKVDFENILPKCINAGAENIELHATIFDDKPVMRDWRLLDSLVPNNYVSMCLDRTNLSNNNLISRVQSAYDVSGERTIIQADGDPMSGSKDEFNTTLPAISTADVVQKSGIPVKILASGGTNSKTKELSDLCGVWIHGVSIGTYARKLVKKHIMQPDFDQNISLISDAVEIARRLININIKEFISG